MATGAKPADMLGTLPTSGKLAMPEDFTSGADLGRAAIAGAVHLTPEDRFYAISPKGERVQLRGDELAGAHYNNFKIEAPSESEGHAEREKYSGGINAAKALALASANAATFGASNSVLTGNFLGHHLYDGAVSPETIEGLEKYQHGSSLLGEFAGTIGPLLLTGGVAGAAKLGLKGAALDAAQGVARASRFAPTALLGKATEHIAEHVGEHLLARTAGGRVARILSRGAGAAIGSAVEGAAYAGGHVIGEQALGDSHETAEEIVAHIGAGALYGGGIGGILGALGGAISKAGAFGMHGNHAPNPAADNLAAAAEAASQHEAGALGAEAAAGAGAEAGAGATPAPPKKIFNVIAGKVADMISSLSGVENTYITKLLEDGPEGERLRHLVQTGPAVRNDLTRSLSKSLNEMSQTRRAVTDGVTGVAKEGIVLANTPAHVAARPVLADTRRMFMEMMHGAPESATEAGTMGIERAIGDSNYNQALLKRAKTYILDAQKRIERVHADGSLTDQQKVARTFVIVDKFKRQFGENVYRVAKSDNANYASRETVRLLDPIYLSGPQAHLENAALYGAENAAAQVGLNRPWTKFLGTSGYTERRLFEKIGDQAGVEKIYRANGSAVKNQIDNLGSAAHDEQNLRFGQYIDNSTNLVNAAIKHGNLSPQRMTEALKFKAAVNNIRRSLAEAADVVKAQNAMRELEAAQRNYPGIGQHIKLLAAGAGFTALGPVGSVLGYGAAHGVDFLLKPANLIRGLAMLERVKGKTGISITDIIDSVIHAHAHDNPITHVKEAAGHVTREHVRDFLIKAASASEHESFSEKVHGGPKGGHARPASTAHEPHIKTLPERLRSGATGVGEGLLHHLKEDEADAPKIDTQADHVHSQLQIINDAASDPHRLMQKVNENLAPVVAIAPNVAQQMQQLAVRTISYLQDKSPKNPNPYVLSGARRPFTPSGAQMHSWGRTLRAVQDPLSVLDDLKAGNVTREGVDALKHVYPSLYLKIQKQAITALGEAKSPLPYGKLVQLGLLLEMPMDPSLQSGYLNMVQSASVKAPPPGPARAAPKKSPSENDDLGGRMGSAADRIQESA